MTPGFVYATLELKLGTLHLPCNLRLPQVKHLKDGLRSVVKADVGSLQGMRNLVKGPSGDHKVVPAVELHMFPIDPMNVSSTWQVLLVPTVQEVFGERLYLCNPNSVQTSAQQVIF